MNIFIIICLCCTKIAHSVELKYALFTSSVGFDSSGAVPAIELAEEMVNRNSSILSEYTLVHTEVRDTLVSTCSYLIRSSYVVMIGCVLSRCVLSTLSVTEQDLWIYSLRQFLLQIHHFWDCLGVAVL